MKKFGKKSLFLIICSSGVLFGFLIKFFVLDIYYINGKSMEPTLKDNSYVAVSKLAYGILIPFSQKFIFHWAEPKVGDIVTYLHDDKIVIKRVVAKSGEKLDFLIDSQYNLMIEGKKIPLTKYQFRNLSQFSKVPDGYIFAVGDNYNNSIDSRDYGFILTENIMGKVIGK